jgi:branched-chain amino acid transport system permease protein
MAKGRERIERLDRGIRARTRDMYALMSYAEIIYLIGPRIIPPILLLVFPLIISDPYWLLVMSYAAFYGVASISWDILGGFTGLVSFGHALFIGFGGYSAAILNAWYGVPIYLSIPLGALIGAGLGTLVFAPCLRTKGAYFSLASLVAPLVMIGVIYASAEILGGEEGIYGMANPFNDVQWYYIFTITLLVSFLVIRKVVYGKFGLILQAIRDNEPAVKASGINVVKYKLITLFISGVFASFVGALQAHRLAFVGPTFFNLLHSVSIIAMSTLGGIATIVGPALGAYILVILTEYLRILQDVRMLLYAIILIILLIFRPEGLFRYLERIYNTFERKVVEE